jgi:sec-independent protein translocase protein TatA
MLGIIESEWGIIIVVVVLLLVFGGSQIPKLAKSLGSAQSQFKKGLAEGKAEEAEADATKSEQGAKADTDGTANPKA